MTERPPAAVIEDLDPLRAAPNAAVPAKSDTNLLMGTWNVRAVGDLIDKWVAGPKD